MFFKGRESSVAQPLKDAAAGNVARGRMYAPKWCHDQIFRGLAFPSAESVLIIFIQPDVDELVTALLLQPFKPLFQRFNALLEHRHTVLPTNSSARVSLRQTFRTRPRLV